MPKPVTDFTQVTKVTTDFAINSAVEASLYDDSTIEYDAEAVFYDDVDTTDSTIETKLPVDWTLSYGD